MHVSTYALFGAIEAFALLLVIAIVLLLYISRLKKRVRHFQAQNRQLLTDIERLKVDFEQTRAAFSNDSSYKQQINDQLLLTREYHKTLDAGRDIALDLNPEAPQSRHIAAFRHAVLIAEKESLHRGSDGTPDWRILENKLSQLIRFYTHGRTRSAEESGGHPQEEADEGLEENEEETANGNIGNMLTK